MNDSQDTSYSWQIPRPVTLPKPTYFPLLFAISLLFLLWGLISLWLLSLAGALGMGLSLIGWVRDILHENNTGDD